MRNPFDTLVSRYFWTTRKSRSGGINNTRPSIEDWLRQSPKVLNENLAQYYIDGECCIDSFVRFERFEEDLVKLERLNLDISGLWHTFKMIHAKGNVRPKDATVSSVLSERSDVCDLVRFFNKDTIERFDYSIDC